ncbi:MAG: ATP synthase F1 subunit delta [Phycisphaerales bacterium]|nr:ATP synthase F1 subunit delta [Phycisphaerales bacterium]
MPSTLHAIDSVDRVYGRSLFELAKAAGGRAQLDEVFDELEQLLELARQNPRLGEFLRSPIIEHARREASLRRILEGQVSDLVLKFVLTVARKGRLAKLQGITAAFQGLYYQEYGTLEMDVWTASALGAEQAAGLRERLKAIVGREIVLHQYVDPAMIGGIRVRSGDYLFDASISGQLRRLRQSIDDAGAKVMRERARGMLEE